MSETVVVLRPLGLGDFLTGVPAYRAIARAFPDHRRVLAAPEALRDLARSSGAFHDLVATAPLAPLPAALHGAAVGIDLHGRGPASQRVLLAADVRRLISFACPEVPATDGSAPWDPAEHEVRRWCRMLAHHGIAADAEDLVLPSPPAPPRGLASATVVHPGAASGSRRWPAARFAAIARAEARDGRRVLVTGSAAERDLALAVAHGAGLPASAAIAGTTSPLALAAIVAHARRVVSGDTGIAHLAAAFRIPSVTLYGPTSPATWGLPAHPRHRILWHGTTGDPHGETVDPGLARITLGEVRAELDALERATEPRRTA